MNSMSDTEKLLQSLQKEEADWKRLGRWVSLLGGLLFMVIYCESFLHMFQGTKSIDEQPITAGFWMFFIGSMSVAWTLGRWRGDRKNKIILRILEQLHTNTIQ